MERDAQEPGRPCLFLFPVRKQVSTSNYKKDGLMTFRASDPLIVLRDRESRSHGEGVDRDTQSAKVT